MKNKELYIPKINTNYFYLDEVDGKIKQAMYFSRKDDLSRVINGNCFKNKRALRLKLDIERNKKLISDL